MEIQSFANITKGLKDIIELISKRNIEKGIFKILLGVWLFVILLTIILIAVLGPRYDIEKKVIKAATGENALVIGKAEIVKYESLLNSLKSPEGIEKYTREIKYDPFAEYKKDFTIQPSGVAKYDFVLKYIDKIQLPLVYKGYIELPDKIIGQMDWQGKTRFVEIGATLSDYTIYSLSKEKMEAIDKKGKKIEFRLNKRVFGDELQAVLYDNISHKEVNVKVASEIGDYKVIDIAPDYVILLTKGVEVKLTK
jgi:hypothetical protein